MDELRKSINAMVAMLKASKHMSLAKANLDVIFEMNHYLQKDYDDNSSKYTETEEAYKKFSNVIFRTIGEDVYSKAEKAFIFAMSDKELAMSLFNISDIHNPKKAFSDAFYKLKDRLDLQEDGFTLWLSAMNDVVLPNKSHIVEHSAVCPTCRAFPERLPSDMVFSDDTNLPEYVYYCTKCQKYAFESSNGIPIGTLAGHETHKKRKICRKMLVDACNEFGITEFECFILFSRISGYSLVDMNDIECLDIKQCSRVISSYLEYKKQHERKSVKFPRKHKEVMDFLRSGGRLRIIRSLRADMNNKLLIPVSVGDGAFTVNGPNGNERILFPKVLKLEFNKNIITVIHPNKKEYYRMYPKI